MPNFEKIKLETERELKAIIKKNPEHIEKGLIILADEFPVENGAIDLLCVDSGKVLTIIELKIHEEDLILMQAIRYYDSIFQSISRIAKIYPNVEIDEKEDPRVILIAPTFSETLKKCAKYLTLKLDLIEYEALEIQGERGLICRNIGIETLKELPIIRGVDDHLNYITDEKLRELCKEIIEKIKNIGENIEVYGRQFYIGFSYKGRLFSKIETKRNFFYTMAAIAPDWEIDKTKIEELVDFTEDHFNEIKKAYEEMGGKMKEK